MILIPEDGVTAEDIRKTLSAGIARGKMTSIIVVAEGDEEAARWRSPRRCRPSASSKPASASSATSSTAAAPSARDRILASELGAAAVHALLKGETDKMVGRVNNKIVHTPLQDTWEKRKGISHGLYDLVGVLAT